MSDYQPGCNGELPVAPVQASKLSARGAIGDETLSLLLEYTETADLNTPTKRQYLAAALKELQERRAAETSGDDARRTAEYWKAEHLAGNAEIDRLRLELREARLELARTASEGLRAIGSAAETSGDYHGLDNARQVFFYEQDHYYLSNFSAFEIHWYGFDFKTSEHAYQWAKFYGHSAVCAIAVKESDSAHAAFKEAERLRERRRPDWDAVKIKIMRDILRAKAEQHEYVRRKLLQTGDRELIENSWRDDFWGWGPNRDGQNVLGKLWMEIRTELRQEKAGG